MRRLRLMTVRCRAGELSERLETPELVQRLRESLVHAQLDELIRGNQRAPWPVEDVAND